MKKAEIKGKKKKNVLEGILAALSDDQSSKAFCIC